MQVESGGGCADELLIEVTGCGDVVVSRVEGFFFG
jgi:hypothetical protein